MNKEPIPPRAIDEQDIALEEDEEEEPEEEEE